MIIFMGVTGAGKSIQGQLLAERMHIPWVSTGELLRAQAASQPNPEMMAGRLLDDQQMIKLVDDALTGVPNQECVLDGFPRTKVQADWLIEQINSGRLHLEAIVLLKVSEPVMRSRLLSRGRPDDTESAIRQRFLDYQQKTEPLVNELRSGGLSMLKINGEQPVEAVNHSILTALGIA